MSNSTTCCACGTVIRRHHRGLDQVCWECSQSPDVMAELELRGGRALREDLIERDDGCLFDPIGGDEL